MSEPIEETTAASGDPAEETTAASGDTDEVVDISQLKKLRRENANLRKKYRELETAHEGDLARIAAAEKREAEQAAAAVLVDPEDLWRYADAETQQQFVDQEFGGIIGDRVKEAAQAIADARPHLGKSQRPPSDQPIEGLRAGASPEPKPAATTWAQALR